MHIYPWQIVPPAIKHRCLEYCYTKLGTSNGISIYRTMHIYLWQIDPPPLLQLSIDALHTATPNLTHLMADLYIYIEKYTHGRLTPPPPIKHRSLQNYCTK